MHIWFKHIKQECIKHAMICFYIIVSTLYTILNLPYAKLHCLLLLAKAMSVLIMSGGGWDSLFHQGPLHRPHRNLCSSTPRHPSALTLETAELFLSHFLTHLSELPLCSRFFFFFFSSWIVLFLGPVLQLWPAAGPFQSQLELSLIWNRTAAGFCSQRPVLQPNLLSPFHQNLAM